MTSSKLRVLLLSASAMVAVSAPAFAATATATVEQSTALDEIVITGTLRSEKLQDLPLAVTAVSEEEFTNAGFKEPRDLQFLSPSIQVSIQGANAIYIRGSGTNSQNGGTEQSVGMVIDGVLMGFVDDIGGDIADLDHMEVFRGPQGTQFAKNASAGVVSVMTKRPIIGSLSGNAHFTYGEHNDSSNNATINLPINDTMAARFSASFQHRDGVFENPSLGEKQGGREMVGVKGKFLWTPTDSTSVYVSADFRRQTDKPNFPQAWAFCGPGILTPAINYTGTRVLPGCNSALIAGITPSPTNSVIAERDDAYRHTNAGGVSLELVQDIGAFKLTSLTAYRFMDRVFHGPAGSGYYNNFFLNNFYEGDQISQEFRLTSPAGERLTYVAGAYLYKRDTTTVSEFYGDAYGQAYVLYPNTPYGAAVQVSNNNGGLRSPNINKSYAVFADGTFNFTDKLRLNAGARVTKDDVYAGIFAYAIPGVYPGIPGGRLRAPGEMSVEETGYTYRISPQYFFTPDLQDYGTFAHGYKGPLIDNSIAILNPIKPEEVDMYELGVKSSWFDHRLTANLTLFHQKFKNYQVTVLNQQVVPSLFQLGNAGGMLSKGFELELNGKVTEDLTLSFGYSYNDSEYTDYATSCWNALEPIKQATSGVNGCWIRPGTTTPSTNAAGTPLINSSKDTYRIGVNYAHTFGNGYKVGANATYLHRSKWLSAPMDPNIVNPGYGVLNLAGGVTTPDEKYRLGFFARNALDEFFLAGRQANNGGWTNVLNPESVRTVGVSLDVRFGQ